VFVVLAASCEHSAILHLILSNRDEKLEGQGI
jgi:hypothetical protein